MFYLAGLPASRADWQIHLRLTVAADGKGKVYVLDTLKNIVRIFEKNGVYGQPIKNIMRSLRVEKMKKKVDKIIKAGFEKNPTSLADGNFDYVRKYLLGKDQYL